MEIHESLAIVTGGPSGLGAASVEWLTHAGAKVAIEATVKAAIPDAEGLQSIVRYPMLNGEPIWLDGAIRTASI